MPVGFTYDASCPVSKLTGKERDAESGLDDFGARYFGSSPGRFMSPDTFYKDSHVGDPQSWNEYAYARNNPLRYTEPNGENATVTTNCTTDAQNNTTCNVNISASVAIYSAEGANLSQEQLNAAASTIQNTIQNAWSGSFTEDGVTYNVSTSVSVSVYGSESAATNSGAQNVIGLSNGPADAAHSINSEVFAKSLGTALFGGPDKGIWNFNTLGQDAGHEFTHLLGTFDKPGAVLSNTNILNDPSIPRAATSSDFGWGIREATSGVNSWVHAPQNRSMRYGEIWEKPSTYFDRTTVGAPLFWWK
jgi:RHS repeat-associated protein